MLLVAITGPIGSEKTTTLLKFAESVVESGASVDGFVSSAGIRRVHGEGAESYTLHWIPSQSKELFAKRDDEGKFQIEASTLEHLKEWSHSLPPKQDLIVMDEFGKWESAGGGLMPFWQGVVQSKPRMIVVTLREGLRTEIESQMGRRFDRVIDVDAGGACQELQAMFAELRDWERVGVFGASAGALECSLGSWLHAVKFPFTGTVMGSLQCAVLALSSGKLGRKELIVWISTIAAGLKAISPGRNRIMPVVAITVQGFLFTIGATIGKWTKVGFGFGAFLVGAWALFQGFFIQYLFFGRALELTFDASATWLHKQFGVNAPSMWVFVGIMCALNGAISIGITLLTVAKHREGLTSLLANARSGERSQSATRILFWLPLVFVTLILFFTRQPLGDIVWMLLRVLGVSLSLFGFAKLITHLDGAKLLNRMGLWGPAVAMRTASEKVSLPRE